LDESSLGVVFLHDIGKSLLDNFLVLFFRGLELDHLAGLNIELDGFLLGWGGNELVANAGENGSEGEHKDGGVKDRILEGNVFDWNFLSSHGYGNFAVNIINDVLNLLLNFLVFGPLRDSVFSVKLLGKLFDLTRDILFIVKVLKFFCELLNFVCND